MSCGYACVNCGKCKGEVRPALAAGLCPACGAENDPEASRCAQCGMLLPPKAGEKPAVRLRLGSASIPAGHKVALCSEKLVDNGRRVRYSEQDALF